MIRTMYLLAIALLLGITGCDEAPLEDQLARCGHLLTPGWAKLDGVDKVWVVNKWLNGTAWVYPTGTGLAHQEVWCSRLSQPRAIEPNTDGL